MFDKLKAAGQLAGMLKDLPKMQGLIEEVRARLATTKVEGSAGGGAVKAVAYCDIRIDTVTLDPSKPDAGSVKIAIPVESVDTNSAQRDGHLKNADFFNAKENPEITFTSTAVKAKGDDLEIAGELAMAGKSKAITIVAQKVGASEMKGKRVGYSSEFTVKRSDFGMKYGVEKGTLGDQVRVVVSLEGIRG